MNPISRAAGRAILRQIRKSAAPPGTPPGTLRRRETPLGPTRMRLIRYDIENISEAELMTPEGLEEVPESRVSWLDISGPDADLIADLGQRLGVHPLALEDVLNLGQRPKFDDYDDSLYIVLDLVSCDQGGFNLKKEQISLVLQGSFVVSVREHQSDVFEPVVARLKNSATKRLRSAGGDYLAYALIDTVVDHFFPVLDRLGDRIETIEEVLLDEPTREDLAGIHDLKRDLLLLRRSAWPLREVLSNLQRTENALVTDGTQVFIRDVSDHIAVVIDIIEIYREMASNLVELYMSSISNRMNEVMKVLTIIATIFIPLSFIAGLYGMNFDTSSPWNMPELRVPWGYPAVLGLMASVVVALLWYFRHKRWL